MQLRYFFLLCIANNFYAQPAIIDFNPKQHLSQVMALIESEKDLAYINYNKVEVEKQLVNLNSHTIPCLHNKTHIKLLYENEKMVGIISYSQFLWILRYIGILVVDKEFRGKGYAKRLLEYAAHDNGKENAHVIMGQALSDNKHAIEIYKKLGAKIQQPSCIERACSAVVNTYNKMRGNPPNPQTTFFAYDMRTLPIKK